MPDPWPPRHLVLRTPRLELRPDDDAGLHELVEVALAGVHPAAEMPFATPWTDQPPDDLARGTMQHHWQARAGLSPAAWAIHFLVRHEGRVVGTQGLMAKEFAVTRTVLTGSWLGRAHQGQGLGTEMRAAVLLFAFDGLAAVAARSSAFADNPASARVSERLGYHPDGTRIRSRRGRPVTETRYLLEARWFVRPAWTLATAGLDGCRDLLGVTAPAGP